MGITVEQLVDLAKECDASDPTDFGFLNIKEEEAFNLMANHVMGILNDNTRESALEVISAVCTKLLVENFVLNLKLENVENTEIK